MFEKFHKSKQGFSFKNNLGEGTIKNYIRKTMGETFEPIASSPIETALNGNTFMINNMDTKVILRNGSIDIMKVYLDFLNNYHYVQSTTPKYQFNEIKDIWNNNLYNEGGDV